MEGVVGKAYGTMVHGLKGSVVGAKGGVTHMRSVYHGWMTVAYVALDIDGIRSLHFFDSV